MFAILVVWVECQNKYKIKWYGKVKKRNWRAYKYDPGSFENFCSEYGYDTMSDKAEKTYNAVYDEWLNVSRLFNDEQLEVLQLIQ